MTEEKIRIKLPNARQKLQTLFPEDSRGDIRIEFGQRQFKLQKAFLRLESGYFKKAFSANSQVLSIHEKFNPLFFTNVLRCFYGFTIELSRSEVVQYYPIVKFLEVESLIKLLRQDIINKVEHYDIFVLMQLAHRFDQQEIFETCLNALEKEEFEQLRYNKMELLRCPTQLFKMVIKTHNRFKAENHKGIPFSEIDQIIKDYSDEKKLSQVQYQQLKFQLIDKNSLSSQEYKQIFLDDAKRKKTSEYCSMIRMDPSPTMASTMRENPFISSRLTESLINPMQKNTADELTLQMEHTWEKKKNEQLKAENEFLFKEMEELKDSTFKNKKMIEEMKQAMNALQKKVEENEKNDRQQATIINKLKKVCDQLKREIEDKNETIKKLEEKVQRLDQMSRKRMSPGAPNRNSKFINIDDEADESRTIQSQIVPGHLLKQIAKPAADALSVPPSNSFKKAKSQPTVMAVIEAKVEQQELDDESIQEMYTSRLDFDIQPRGCPKKLLPNLASFLTGEGFQKKTLSLIFRKNISNQDTLGSPSDLFNRNSLLVLICTRMNQVIGGFTSIEISKNQKDYISDYQAFIFSLTKNEKFKIKKNSASEAIFITPDYLICFSNDLMISSDCIRTQSQSDWPCAYEGGQEKRTSKWLTGEDGGFSIKDIQIYQVKEEAMIMDL